LHQQEVNRVSGAALIVLSLIVLFAVLSGYTQPPQPDEGTAAHIFQLSIVAGNADFDAFPLNHGLEAAFAKPATVGASGRLVGSRVWSTVSS